MDDNDFRKNKNKVDPEMERVLNEALETAKETRKKVRDDIDNGRLPEIPDELKGILS